jgi:hypothetical protein
MFNTLSIDSYRPRFSSKKILNFFGIKEALSYGLWQHDSTGNILQNEMKILKVHVYY